jgi:hypothetical protein
MNLDQYTLINGKNEYELLTEAFEALKLQGIKANFGRSLAKGTGRRVWVDASSVTHSFQSPSTWKQEHLIYNLYIEANEVEIQWLIDFFRTYGLDAQATGNNWLLIVPRLSAAQRSHLEDWGKAKDLYAQRAEQRKTIGECGMYLGVNSDIAPVKNISEMVRTMSDTSRALWYTEQDIERTYFMVYKESRDWNDVNNKYDVARLNTMTAEEVLAL